MTKPAPPAPPAPLPEDPAGLAARVAAGEKRAIARAISRVENRDAGTEALLGALFPRTGKAFRVGVTGAPGAGKSTLVNAIAGHLRAAKTRVAIVAVDPSSPFTGGALLGDRVRMLALDPEVFIRSMSSRGHLGGIASATDDACDVLDAAGFEVVLVETVGVGQSEVEIAAATDATLVVVTPEGGDSIQTLKAGLLEVADVIVVNKADRDGARELAGEIEHSLTLRTGGAGTGWAVPVMLASATAGTGVAEAWQAVLDYRKFLEDKDLLRSRRRKNLEHKIRRIVESALARTLWGDGKEADGRLREALGRAESRALSPHAAARELLAHIGAPSRPLQ